MGWVRRARYGLVASMILASIVLQIMRPGLAYAYGQIADRSITMSSSQSGATNVSYLVTFEPATSGTIGSIAIDFCGNTPIIGDTCYNNNSTTPAAPTPGTHTPSFPSPAATVTGGAGVGNLTTGTWAAATVNSGRTFTLTNTGSAMSFTAGVSYYFTITGATNPSDVDDNTVGNQLGTFYSRILTFPNAASSNYADAYTGTNLGANIPIDAGGIAISTASQITITAKVQERIVFCVYTTGTGNNCTTKSGDAITLGDNNGVLDPVGPYVDTSAKYTVSTNAASGVAIRMRGTTLTSGSNTIAPNASPATSAAGTEQFGLCTYESASVVGGQLTPATKYNGTTGGACAGTTQTAGTNTPGGTNGATFAFDPNTTDGTLSTYGDIIANKVAGDFSTGTLVFVGNVSNATEAGIYTTTLSFIATGTY
jgi:hypothetical protein